MNPIRHKLLPDTDDVLIMFDHGGMTITRRISPDRAKSFAWGLLADLDPDETQEVCSTVMPFQQSAAMRRRQPDEPPRWLLVAIGLGFGPAGKRQLTQRLRKIVTAWDLADLCHRGIAERIDGGAVTRPATYALTELGWSEVLKHRAVGCAA